MPVRSGALPAAVAALLASTIVVARLLLVAHGNPADFVDAGRSFVNPAVAPASLPVHASGYDGQFYYRLALDPFDYSRTAFGITLDVPYRIARIGYPLVAWLLSLGGTPALVPWALVGVNVAALGALGWGGALIAVQGGRTRWLGLLVPGYFGLLMSLARDTTEPLELALVVSALLAVSRSRNGLAAALLSLAVLTRETATIAVAAIALGDLYERAAARRRGWPQPTPVRAATWIVPSLVFFAWQAALWGVLGSIPLLGDTRSNAGAPFSGLWQAIVLHLAHPAAAKSLFWFGQAGVLVAVWVWAAVASPGLLGDIRETYARPPAGGPQLSAGVTGTGVLSGGTLVRMAVPMAFLGNVVLALSLPPIIWDHALADLRPLADSFVFAVLVLLSSRLRLRLPAAATALAWIVVAAYRMTSL